MDQPLPKLALTAVRLAAMSHFGPLAGGIFLTGGALAAKLLAAGDATDIFTGIATSETAQLFDRALHAFHTGRNADIE